MSLLGDALGLIFLDSQKLSSFTQTLLRRALVTISLTVLTGMMAGAFLCLLLYGLYLMLLINGLEPSMAVLTSGIAGMLFTIIIGLLTGLAFNKFLKTFDARTCTPSVSRIAMDTLDAFLYGLNGPEKSAPSAANNCNEPAIFSEEPQKTKDGVI